MKIQIICEKCKKIAEYIPKHEMYEVDVHSIKDSFIAGVDWDNEIKENWNEDFIAALTSTHSENETEQILYSDLAKNIYAETSDFDLCFTCRGCGDQIVLNQFALDSK